MNVTALVREVDGHWGVAERYVYDPYGHVTVLNGGKEEVEPDTWVYFDDDGDVTEWAEDAGGSDWDNRILYAGYRFDAETGLYHVRHRMYHPTLGRWIQRDPAGYVDGMGLYAYVASEPTVRTDPLGKQGFPDFGMKDAAEREWAANRAGHLSERQKRQLEQAKAAATIDALRDAEPLKHAVEFLAGKLPLDSICAAALESSLPAAKCLHQCGCDPDMQGEGEYWGGEGALNAEGYIPLIKGVGPGGGVGLGIQLIVLCDSGQYCCYFFGKVKGGPGAGAAVGGSGTSLHGKGASRPEHYAGYSSGVEFAAGPSFGLVGGGAWGEEAKGIEGGPTAGLGGCVSATAKREYFVLVKCRGLD